MLQILPIALAQLKAGNKVRQMVHCIEQMAKVFVKI